MSEGTRESTMKSADELPAPAKADSPTRESVNGGPKKEDTLMSDAHEPEGIDLPLDEHLPIKPQSMPVPQKLKDNKPSAKDVIVLAFGSNGIRYGFAADSTPKRLFPAVALPRRAEAIADPNAKALCIPTHSPRSAVDVKNAGKGFAEVRDEIDEELLLHERRRGGGRPIPYKCAVESIPPEKRDDAQQHGLNHYATAASSAVPDTPLVGREVELLVRDKERAKLYDIIFPMWDGKLLFDCGAPSSVVRKSLDVLIDHVVKQLADDRKNRRAKASPRKEMNGVTDSAARKGDPYNAGMFESDGTAKVFVAVVIPETSQRRDAAEIVGAIFRSKRMQAAAVFIHQSAVSCALGAGLATCAVVDIGHSATTIGCVEDGLICGESRIHLKYGSVHIQNAFDVLLRENSKLRDLLRKEPGIDNNPVHPIRIADDEGVALAKIAEQTGSFNVEENDTLAVAMVKVPSGRALRVKLGVGVRTLPCFGLIYPKLLRYAHELVTPKKGIPRRGVFEMNADDDNFASDIFNDLRRSGIATAALPIGTFANDPGQPAAGTVDPEQASLVDAIIWSIARAVEVKRPDQQSRTAEHYRRYLNAIVLAGGGASIDGIALALEARIKKGFLDAGLNVADVTVIDGGKGKGDEELAAAAAVLKDVASEGGLVDDTDTASLPWKGGAVMVEADAVTEYWIYRDDWESRNVRALRERAPFYW